jgi:hypothetical protein
MEEPPLPVNGIGPTSDVRVTAGILRDDLRFEFEGCGAAATGSTTYFNSGTTSVHDLRGFKLSVFSASESGWNRGLWYSRTIPEIDSGCP